MGNVRVRSETGHLFIDFRYRGVRCREQTTLPDSPANRRRLSDLLARIEAEITLGTFDYARHFPDSPRAIRFLQPDYAPAPGTRPLRHGQGATAPNTPNFRDFANAWFTHMCPQWRESHRVTVRATLDRYLIPRFGDKAVNGISKSDVMGFRAWLSSQRGRSGALLSAERVNHIINPLRMLMAEAAEQFDFLSPCRGIKSLKVPKSDVQPFTLDEVKLILDTVRPDFRNYYIVRFLTGMRTGEIDGLQWKYVDFSRRLILVRETVVNFKPGFTKNDGSQRDIQMSRPVFDALKAQQEATGKFDYVFCTKEGTPLSHHNVTQRVWHPLLRHLGLPKRRPYQTRHTAATLWLAAGENPEWIARQMGHTTTEMLFRVYSRYVPNLTRQDGSAFDRLLSSNAMNIGGGPCHD